MKKIEYESIGKLVKKIKEGDMDAFNKVYEATSMKVYYLCLNILKNKESAEDAVQEIFIIVLKSVNKLENEKLFIAWLNRISYNYCIKEVKKKKKINEENIEDIDTINTSEEEKTPLNSYLDKENKKEMMELINKLSPIHSAILIMRYYQYMKINQIAYALEISEGTVKSRLNNAKKKLAVLYNAENEKTRSIFGFMLIPTFNNWAKNNPFSNKEAILIRILVEAQQKHLIIENISKYENNINILESVENIVSKTLVVTVSAISIALGGSTVNTLIENSSNEIAEKKINILDDIEGFINIDKSITYTNKDVILNIKSKSGNIKNVTIDGLEKGINVIQEGKNYEIVINENGSYLLKIESKSSDKIIKNIEIDNIDKESPSIKKYFIKGDSLHIQLEDNLSGIEKDRISLKDSDGKNIKIKSINIEKKELIYKLEYGEMILNISDQAGNVVSYAISIK